jgi:hypothetical protein
MIEFDPPETRYAQSGDLSIAYQILGDGPVDLILVPGVVSHIEFLHEPPGYTAFLGLLRDSLGSSHPTSADRACRTASAPQRLSKSGWMICALSWTPSARARRFS